MTSEYIVRPARADELPLLAAIERAAVALFGQTDMPELRDAPVLELSEVQGFVASGGFVAVAQHAQDGVVGFVIVRPLGGCAHVQEIDVLPVHGGRGLGRRMLEAALDWSRAAGYPAATLTTFRDIPWNAPFYRRCGFVELALADASAELLEQRRLEGTYGFRTERRIIMKKDLQPMNKDLQPAD